jgi:SNF2 family DNA or RNA helicase
LRQQIGIAKVPVALEFIKDFHDENPNKNLIVFAHHHKVSDQIYYGLQDIYKEQIVIRKIDGRTPKKLYQENIDEFQKNKIKVFIVGIQGAVGYNLTKASTALFVEMLYVPSDLVQAEDRLWRIGTEDNVNIYYLVARNTLDAYMMQILQNKNKIISEVLEGMQIKDDGIERCLKMICG